MERMISHEEVQELLGAYALDAVEPNEKALVDYHLDSCPRCRDELRNHREVVGLLAYSGQDAPPGLWDRVVEQINDAGPGSSAPTLRPVSGPPAPPKDRRLTARVVLALAAAAVIVIAVLACRSFGCRAAPITSAARWRPSKTDRSRPWPRSSGLWPSRVRS